MAAAGSAVGLGNIWAFPNQVASNGGAAFLLVYLVCCFSVGYPLMVAELTIGRHTGRNPVGAFRALAPGSRVYPLIGFWGILCGVGIHAFYNVIAGWTLGYVFEEVTYAAGATGLSQVLSDLSHGHKNALFSCLFMTATVMIVAGGVSSGIERATRTMMPALLLILLTMIVYVIFQEGSREGIRLYLQPDLSKINPRLVLNAMGQAFFSLSLGIGTLITYGSYLNRKQNIPRAAAFVTGADISIAFLAGFLIIPAMFVAQRSGIQIFDDQGNLVSSTGLVFNTLPNLFHTLGPVGAVLGLLFFVLLSIAALTSTISLLEVPVAYLFDEWGIERRRAAIGMGMVGALLSLFVAYDPSWIDPLVNVFLNVGLPVGGLMICLFLGFVWKTQPALTEIEEGRSGTLTGSFWEAVASVHQVFLPDPDLAGFPEYDWSPPVAFWLAALQLRDSRRGELGTLFSAPESR